MKISRKKSSDGATPLPSVGPMAGPSGSRPKKVEKTDKADPVEPNIGVSLSGTTQQVAAVRKQLDAIPDVRMDKIVDIKMAVDAGSYKVESGKVAKKMIDESLRESARFTEKKQDKKKD